MQHRNSQKRDYSENNVYFVTANCFETFCYFQENIFCEIFIQDLKIAKELKEFKFCGFCLNYNHIHLLVHPSNKFNVSEIMQNIKRTCSLHTNQIISGNLSVSDNIYCSLQRDFFVQMRNRFIQKYGPNQVKFPKFKWQKSFHDHIIKNSIDFENHNKYTIFNFQKHNLPENWKYTSLNYSEMIDGIEL